MASWLWTFGQVPEVSAEQLDKLVKSLHDMSPEQRQGTVTIIDVRTEGEYKEGHVAYAVNASFLPPWGFASRIEPLLQGVPKDARIITICLSAHRSIGALKWLREKGYTNVQQLAKGMKDWRAKQLPEVKGPQPAGTGAASSSSSPAK